MRLRAVIGATWRATLGVIALLLVATVAFWPAVTRGWMTLDLHRYAKVVRNSECSLADKERLLDLIDNLQDQLRQGATLSAVRWAECDDSLEHVMAAGIAGDEVRLIERELQRVSHEISDAND